jgi:hypothetical protein
VGERFLAYEEREDVDMVQQYPNPSPLSLSKGRFVLWPEREVSRKMQCFDKLSMDGVGWKFGGQFKP